MHTAGELVNRVLAVCRNGASLPDIAACLGKDAPYVQVVVTGLLAMGALDREERPDAYGDLYRARILSPGSDEQRRLDASGKTGEPSPSFRVDRLLQDPTYREITRALIKGGTARQIASRLELPERAVAAALEVMTERGGPVVRSSDWNPYYRVDPTFRVAFGDAVRLLGPTSAVAAPIARRRTKWDAFVSYAFEDRADVVRPLASALSLARLHVWYDEYELLVGDSLVEKISDGMRESRCGILILSPAFVVKKGFTQWEFRGLVEKHINGEGFLLPVLHNIAPQHVRELSPALGDIFALSTSLGIEAIAAALVQRVRALA